MKLFYFNRHKSYTEVMQPHFTCHFHRLHNTPNLNTRIFAASNICVPAVPPKSPVYSSWCDASRLHSALLSKLIQSLYIYQISICHYARLSRIEFAIFFPVHWGRDDISRDFDAVWSIPVQIHYGHFELWRHFKEKFHNAQCLICRIAFLYENFNFERSSQVLMYGFRRGQVVLFLDSGTLKKWLFKINGNILTQEFNVISSWLPGSPNGQPGKNNIIMYWLVLRDVDSKNTWWTQNVKFCTYLGAAAWTLHDLQPRQIMLFIYNVLCVCVYINLFIYVSLHKSPDVHNESTQDEFKILQWDQMEMPIIALIK